MVHRYRSNKQELPPMVNEPNQAEIDAQQAQILREGTKK